MTNKPNYEGLGFVSFFLFMGLQGGCVLSQDVSLLNKTLFNCKIKYMRKNPTC